MSRGGRKRITRAKAAGRLVDVYCDASHKGALGAWAGVAVRADRPTIEASGTLRGAVWHSELAELRAAGNALHAAHKGGLIAAGDLVVLRSDNRNNVNRINAGSCSEKLPDMAKALAWILRFAEEGAFELIAAHVKGHQSADSEDPHAVHNRRCDLLCRRLTKAQGGRGPTTLAEARRAAAVQSSRAKRQNAERAIAAARKLAGRQ
jgi:ribonuclease HI